MLVSIDMDNFGEDKVLDSIRKSPAYSIGSFRREWLECLSRAQMVSSAAKIYVLDNYKKVSDYSELSLRLIHNQGKQYFGLRDRRSNERKETPRKTSPVLERISKELDDKTIQIDSFDEAVYDWTDGDFSVSFNGVWYLWIDDESVVSIASFIEKKLTDGNNNKL